MVEASYKLTTQACFTFILGRQKYLIYMYEKDI